MPHDKLKVYFLGSGAFAVPVLEAIAASDRLQLAGAGTQPDRPAGRKRTLTPTPVGRRADELRLACERIPSVNEEAFLSRMEALQPDFIIVVSFGQLLKERILNLPRCGCLNIHASLLPRHRGASPVAASILAGDQEAGIGFMRMDKGLDTGPVYCSYSLPLLGDETTETLEAALSKLSASHLEDVCLRVASGALVHRPQDHSLASVSKKIRKHDGSLDWREDAAAILRKVRAYNRWPGVSFRIATPSGAHLVKILDASPAEGEGAPGQTLKADRREWVVACGKGSLSIKRIVPEGKKDMSFLDFLHGSHLKPGDILLNGPEKTTGDLKQPTGLAKP